MMFIRSFLLTLLLTFTSFADTPKQPGEQMQFGRFGTITLYRTAPHPARIVLFVSGDGGWNLGVIDMARMIAEQNALVVGIDITHYLNQLEAAPDKCSYPAADFEALSQYVQQKLGFPDYKQPVLVGYSSGATLVYALLVQAPPNTFAGAISMGFCPDLPLTKPFCKGNGLQFGPGPKGKGYSFLPAKTLEQPWVAFQGLIDEVCSPAFVDSFVGQVPRGKVVRLPHVGHGFSVQRNWAPQFREAVASIFSEDTSIAVTVAGPDSLKDLPLVEVPVKGPEKDYFALILSGDGGWASIDRQIGEYFSTQGIRVVGLNSLRYFWSRKTPDESGVDLARIIKHYLQTWNKSEVVVVGYSRGADVAPFMVNRLAPALQSRIRILALLGLEGEVDFKFHVLDLISSDSHPEELPVKPEMDKLSGIRTLCFYGEDESGSLCPQLDTTKVTVIQLKGGHHFGGDYKSIAEQILQQMD
ncbi:virulence factor family protein [candidate division GN15 bacterium]|uniref:Virulence factor family protein n=1 Tax=candidate division GN15 bacterium TaxID=2072418 RepID=A0A855X405_9BACT|nr:MAG: virulence factor family protein [candidate division GN15 bacterium]